MVNVGKYIPYVDPMGIYVKLRNFDLLRSKNDLIVPC